jgi:hypothetical protein
MLMLVLAYDYDYQVDVGGESTNDIISSAAAVATMV